MGYVGVGVVRVFYGGFGATYCFPYFHVQQAIAVHCYLLFASAFYMAFWGGISCFLMVQADFRHPFFFCYPFAEGFLIFHA